MKHIHIFKKIGSSIGTGPNDKWSGSAGDIDYKCECGAWFKAYCQEAVYFSMPNEITGKEEPEPIEVNLE